MKLHLRPAEGLVIPNPETGKDLPAWGSSVENDIYWRRLLKSGDVIKTTETEIAAAEAKCLAEEEGKATAPMVEAAKPTRKSSKEE